MIANYHTHTARCNHAIGAEREYVQAAVDGGLQILGFSDHTPQFFPGEYYSRMRMRPELLEDYVQTVLGLRREYADRLQILLGLEVEYYPAIFGRLLEVLRDTPVEYMILGQHWNCNEFDAPYNGKPTENEGQLAQYCNQVIDAMYTGLFTYLAHPDLIHFTGQRRVYETHMRRLCQAAKACSMPLELNFLGMGENRHYPNPLFWQLAAEEGCCVIFGCDSHRPDWTVMPETEAKAMKMVKQYSLTLLETVPLRKI